MHHPTDRMTHTTAFVKPVVDHWLEREIAQWPDRRNTAHVIYNYMAKDMIKDHINNYYFVALLMLAIRKMCYNLADCSVYTVSSVVLLNTINYCLNNVK